LSDAVLTAIVATIPPTLVAVGTLIVSWRTSGKAVVIDTKATALVGKADVIIHKAEEIHTLTNSNLTKVSTDLALALKRIESLEGFIARGTTPAVGP
jgi:hypothetical protein